MASSSKKNKTNVYRFFSSETGEHYTIRLSKEAVEKLTGKTISKYSRKLRKHLDFKLSKKVGK